MSQATNTGGLDQAGVQAEKCQAPVGAASLAWAHRTENFPRHLSLPPVPST